MSTKTQKGAARFHNSAKDWGNASASGEATMNGIYADMVVGLTEARIARKANVVKVALSSGGRLFKEAQSALTATTIHKDDLVKFNLPKGDAKKPKTVRCHIAGNGSVKVESRTILEAQRLIAGKMRNLRDGLSRYIEAGGATKKGATPRQNDPSCVVDCAALMKVRAKVISAKSDPEKAQGYGDTKSLVTSLDTAIAAFPADVQTKAKSKK